MKQIARKLEEEKLNLISLLPMKFHRRMYNDSYICGGCIYSLKNDQEVNDFDFFVTNQELADELVEYFKGYITQTTRIDESGIEKELKVKKGTYLGYTLTMTRYAISIDRKYQIVIKYVGEPRDVLSEFDFKHNMFFYRNDYVENVADWEYLDTNVICFNEDRPRDICGTLLRVPKFVNKGMVFPKKEVAKMLKKLVENGFDESEKQILEDCCTY